MSRKGVSREDLVKSLSAQLGKDYVYNRERKRLEALEKAALEREGGAIVQLEGGKRLVRMKARVNDAGDLTPVTPEDEVKS